MHPTFNISEAISDTPKCIDHSSMSDDGAREHKADIWGFGSRGKSKLKKKNTGRFVRKSQLQENPL